MQAAACSTFSIAISSEDMPTAREGIAPLYPS
jgi:hypothetical protein